MTEADIQDAIDAAGIHDARVWMNSRDLSIVISLKDPTTSRKTCIDAIRDLVPEGIVVEIFGGSP